MNNEVDREEKQYDREDRQRRLSSLAFNMLRKRDEAVHFRASTGVERRWREDEEAYNGMDALVRGNSMLDYATGEATRSVRNKAQRSQVVVNITRSRCETAAGRFCDIMLPTDDKNWGMQPTPNPELADQFNDTRPALQGGLPVKTKEGKQATVADVARDKRRRAKDANDKMEVEIEDQLVECDYNGEQRKGIDQAVMLGTMILKGPSVVSSAKKKFKKITRDGESTYVVDVREDKRPASRWVDCWNAYPSPGTKANIQRTCEYMWERDEILPRDVRALIGVDGYFDDQLIEVLKEEPIRTSVDNKKGRTGVIHTREARGKAYEYWEYNGDLSIEDLEGIGVDCSSLPAALSASVCIIFINDRPVKVELNTLETGEIPYDFWPWSRVSNDTPWGIGVCRQMIWLQGIITAAWRAMMDNAGDSAGADVVVSRMLTPGGDGWRIGGKTFWFSNDDLEDARTAFAQFQLESRQPQLQSIIELALRFVDLETSMPTIFQGEAQEIPETLGQTNIMVDSSNVGLRNRAKLYDDYITDPHITRYYHFNMLHSDKEEIKGDFQVDARGVRVLLERDQQAQVIAELMALKTDPHFKREINWSKVSRQYVKARKLDVLNNDDELAEYDKNLAEQSEQGPSDPRIVAAQISAESAIQSKKIQADSDMKELQFKAEEAEKERAHKRAMKELELKVAMMDFALKREMKLDELKTQLAISDRSLNQQDRLSKGGGSNEVITPPTEPAGHAEDGRSYEQ